jgi:hypothetical protein
MIVEPETYFVIYGCAVTAGVLYLVYLAQKSVKESERREREERDRKLKL